MSEVTRILTAIEQGDPHAAEQLLPLVYEELRQRAAQKLAQEKPGQPLDATALVHEAYLRLVKVDRARPWKGRSHFFAAAAEAMRQDVAANGLYGRVWRDLRQKGLVARPGDRSAVAREMQQIQRRAVALRRRAQGSASA
jgi:hypothetical protein